MTSRTHHTGPAAAPRSIALPFVVLVDTREQNAWTFTYHPSRDGRGVLDVRTRRTGLNVGDYQAELAGGIRLPIAIERKSLDDLAVTLSSGRDRFQRECLRASEAGIALHIVVEAGWDDVVGGRYESRMSPAAIIGTLVSWSVRYRLVPWLPGKRSRAERLALRLFEHATRVHTERTPAVPCD